LKITLGQVREKAKDVKKKKKAQANSAKVTAATTNEPAANLTQDT
jgi:hypothetical protein